MESNIQLHIRKLSEFFLLLNMPCQMIVILYFCASYMVGNIATPLVTMMTKVTDVLHHYDDNWRVRWQFSVHVSQVWRRNPEERSSQSVTRLLHMIHCCSALCCVCKRNLKKKFVFSKNMARLPFHLVSSREPISLYWPRRLEITWAGTLFMLCPKLSIEPPVTVRMTAYHQ